MVYIEPNVTDAAFCLAAEEYVMKNFSKEYPEEPVFMFWQTQTCVVIGRNQIAAAEIDLQAANSLGVKIFRRSSGGGAIFSDAGNFMHSLIVPFEKSDNPKTIEFEMCAKFIAGALGKMGIPAVAEGRNDITVEGKKISGLAQYAIKNRLCTHGSLLYDTNLELLVRVLQTDPEKISSKAISSIRARVVNLCEYFKPKISPENFFERLKIHMFDSGGIKRHDFTKEEIERINLIKAEKYANPEWITGAAPKFCFHKSRHFTAGKLEIFLDVERGIIKSCKIFGDFLGIYPVEELEQKLTNAPHEFAALDEILKTIDLRLYLGEMKREEVLECLF